ncbi:phosphatase PAP2 family protein [Natrinema altunense]|uniref:Phosphoesterase PA-phosphatase-related protein n=1 Tax=Natrinema altunense (strain JCM 12890 / CGMCC 1.3731 / AJ2) TaxID=1227494 RepID=L9ZDH1_NATA2|nr:phosphatase PAP2 family protein [Natrinema altunense]ELY84515.1 phosphoesterase PA-phosphatase-related protein [Natrinema altunense JCM 12890]
MALGYVTFITIATVCTGVTATCALCVRASALPRTIAELEDRGRSIAPYLGVTLLVLLVKRWTHYRRLELSYALDWDITAEIYAVEGSFVAGLQSIVPDALIGFFSAMYMFGFPYLLVSALVLYFLLGTQRRFKQLLVAYALNTLVGSVFYTLFVAYGPRNHLSTVNGLMYEFYPQTQELTAEVSANTNVFPSLHTSLAVIVALFAWRSRREYPRWFPIASVVATLVVFSTMYLGIHWLIDVVAGVVLGIWCVLTAERLVARAEGEPVSTSDDRETGLTTETND